MPIGPRTLCDGNSSRIFEPRRSSLVAWTVRVAQAADRLALRAFPTSFWSSLRGEGLAERTLNGLGRCCRLLPKHQEVVAVERARLRIQQSLALRQSRLERFQESCRAMQAAGRFLDEGSAGQVHLNPACCWIRVDAEPHGDRSSLSGSVLFFLANDEIRGLRMNLEGQVLVNELADYQPCTIGQWAQLSSLADAGQLSSLVRHLAEIGLVACDG